MWSHPDGIRSDFLSFQGTGEQAEQSTYNRKDRNESLGSGNTN